MGRSLYCGLKKIVRFALIWKQLCWIINIKDGHGGHFLAQKRAGNDCLLFCKLRLVCYNAVRIPLILLFPFCNTFYLGTAAMAQVADEGHRHLPLPEEIIAMSESETACQFCGVSYLVLSRMEALQQEMKKLERDLLRHKVSMEHQCVHFQHSPKCSLSWKGTAIGDRAPHFSCRVISSS